MEKKKRKECTDWFFESRYGLFLHYLYDFTGMNKFDADKFAADVNQTGARYVIFTLGQNSGLYCGPNPTYEKITGNKKGSKCYEGDIPMRAAEALKQYGIRLMLYLPSHPPSRDVDAAALLGTDQRTDEWAMDDNAVDKWCSVIKDWSEHYGKNIGGWWFDGFYDMINLNEKYAAQYRTAALAGNDESIIALNQGIEDRVYPANEYCDYTAGEANEYRMLPKQRFIEEAQWHIASFVGNDWQAGNVLVHKNSFADYIKQVNLLGGVVSVGVYIAEDGTLSREQIELMNCVKQKIWD